MVQKLNRLSARAVATLATPGRHADGGGLYLLISATGAKRWTFMWQRDGRQREAGLGGVSSVPLAKAREIAAESARRSRPALIRSPRANAVTRAF